MVLLVQCSSHYLPPACAALVSLTKHFVSRRAVQSQEVHPVGNLEGSAGCQAGLAVRAALRRSGPISTRRGSFDF